MSFVKIVAVVTGGSRDGTALATAFAAAAPFAAHVEALCVRPDPADLAPFLPEGISVSTMQEIIDSTEEASKIAAENARSTWKAAAADHGVKILPQPRKQECTTTSFREDQGRLSQRLAQAAKLADLVVFPALEPGDRPELMSAFEEVLMKSERPVLLSAHVAPKHIMQKVAIAWDGSFPAAHAINMAMPYLAGAEEIEVLSVRHPPLKPEALEELRAYLNLRGITFTARLADQGDRSAGQVLLDAAGSGMADMLVMGGFGHHRLREALFGGVTQHVVSNASVPVFMVH